MRQPARRIAAAVPVLSVVMMVCAAGTARAELVYFQNSERPLSIKGHRIEGGSLVLSLRAGGEIVCEPSAIARIAPDEVPYPDPPSDPRTAQVDPAGDASAPYAAIIDRIAAEQGVDARLVRAVIQVESAYQRRAVSRKGAMGLMQIMPDTARRYGVHDPYDPAANIEAGIKYLRDLLARFPRDLALAAYNAGEAAVERFRGMPPYPETRSYVARIRQLVSR